MSETETTPGEEFTPTEIGEDDPFAGTDFGDFEAGDFVTDGSDAAPAAEVPDERVDAAAEDELGTDTSDLPVVDREGQPVEAHHEPADAASAESQGGVAPMPETGGEAAVEPVEESGPRVGPTPEAQASMDALKAQREAAPDPPPSSSPAPEAPAEPEAPAAAEAAPDPSPAAPTEQPAASAQSSAPAPTPAQSPPPSSATGAAAGGEAQGATRQRPTHRKYILLRLVGQGQFKQVSWIVDREGRVLPPGATHDPDQGTRRVGVCNARGRDDALKFGFTVLGSPPDGVKLIAVAANQFRLKHVKPEAETIPKTRITIS